MADAICAGCEEPITNGDPFMLWGTEVFHKDRACLALIRQSVGTRQKLAIAKLRQEQIAFDKKIHELKQRNDFLESRADGLVHEVEKGRKDLTRVMDIADDLSKRNDAIATSSTNLRATLRAARDHNGELATQLAAAHAEITKLKNEALTRAASEQPAKKETDTRDPTVIRFSLLEIEPL